MPDQVQLRGGSANENDSFAGAQREVTVDTTNNTLRVHDGTTTGGHSLVQGTASTDADADTIIKRDEWGRAQVADPVDDADIANKGWVAGQIGDSGAVLGYIYGCELTWVDGDDVTFGTGQVADEQTGALIEVESALTKQSDAGWSAGSDAGGMDTGSKPPDGTLHCFIIADESGSQVDALFSESHDNPTLPSGYTRFRRVGSAVTDGNAGIIEFAQHGDTFYRDQIVEASFNDMSQTAIALTVPTGIRVVPLLVGRMRTTDTSSFNLEVSNGDNPGFAVLMTQLLRGESSKWSGFTLFPFTTNVAGEIYVNPFSGNANSNIRSFGWIDTRGRFG